MATLTIPPLLADGGEMTVMRHVASHAFGALSVTYPEGVEPPDDTTLGQGYAYQLRQDPPPFGRGFIRADLDIDAENNLSTVEEVLDDVTDRTAGEALFQRDIPRAGLGRLQPGVDFRVGDLAPVRLWGRILPNQLITAVDDTSAPGDPLGCRVHVGGQLIREPSSLAKGNRDIARQIAQERKERLTQVKAVDKKAEDAKSTAETAKQIAEQSKEASDVALTGTIIEYAVGTSEEFPPTSGWSTSTPHRPSGSFIWMRTRIAYGSGQSEVTSPVLVTGNTGAPGADGTDGTAGKDGLGIQSTVVLYAVGTSGTVAPVSGWFDQVPPLTKGQYLWTRTIWTYTDSSTETGHSVSYIATDGNSGEDGLPGKDGVGIESTVNLYAVSSSGTVPPTSGWGATPPAAQAGQFMWTRTIWTYTDGTTETGHAIGKIGNTGQPGRDGIDGQDGLPGRDGLGLKTTVVSYAVHTSGTTAPTSGWASQVPPLVQGSYLWTRTIWTYTDDSTETGYSVTYLSKDGNSGDNGLPGKDGVGITDTAIVYAVSSSGTSAPTSGWVASPPVAQPGQWMWTRTTWSYSDNTTETGYSVGKIGDTGAPGDKGSDGLPGKDGVGLSSTAVEYALATSGTIAPPTGWSDQVPTLVKGRYLWTRTKWTYTDDSTETGHSVSYISTDGSNGTDGLPGKDGVGIESTTITYAKSTSGTAAPTTGWGTQPPATSPGDFVWTRTVWAYDDNTTETGYSVGKIGETGPRGADGPQGVPGAKGNDGQTTYTWIRYADSLTGAGISNDPTGKTHIGLAHNKPTATESDDPSDYTWSLIKGEKGDRGEDGSRGLQGLQGEAGDQGIPGNDGTDGRPSYTHIAYADSAAGAGFSQSPTGKTYMGVYVDSVATDSTDPSKYRWSLIKGQDGEKGVPGAPGHDGRTPFLHTAWADSADGTVGFSTTDSVGKLYLGVYTDFATLDIYSDTYTDSYGTGHPVDSTDPSRYSWTLIKGEKGDSGADGLPGKDGVGLDETALSYALSDQGGTAPTTGWGPQVPTLTKGKYLWTRTVWTYTDDSTETGYSVAYIAQDGNDGNNGLPGKDGTGIASTVVLYAKSASGVTPPASGWGPQPPGAAPGEWVWTRMIWTYTDGTTETGHSMGKVGETGVPGPKGDDGQQLWTWIKYSDNADGTGLYDVPRDSTRYIGIATNKSTAAESSIKTDYVWSLFRGADGANGADGQGISSTATAYASSASGTSTPTVGWVASIPVVPEGHFLWTRTTLKFTDGADSVSYAVSHQGVDGANGTPGAPGDPGADGSDGVDGRTSYFHTAYANSSDGVAGFSTTDPTGRTYVGTYSDFTEADSPDPSLYSWQLVKGADGAPGKGVSTVTVTYASSASGTSAPTSGWQSTMPAVPQGHFLWTRTLTRFTDGATTTVDMVARQGVDGQKGTPGAPGHDGRTPLLHVAYANSADGTVDFSTTDPSGRTYLGTYTNFATLDIYSDVYTDSYGTATPLDSTDPARYSWALIKGTDGVDGVDGADGTDGVSVAGMTIYYRLVSRDSSTPSRPTVENPSGWTTTEPDYQSGTSLYQVIKVTYSNGAFAYTDVSLVSAYMAAASAIEVAEDGVERAKDINAALTGSIDGDLSAAMADSETAIGAVADAATTARDWTEDNQQDFNNTVALANAAQAKVNDVNLINWETQAERNALQTEVDEAQNVALRLQENAIQWSSILAVRTFSTPNLSSSWTVEYSPWIGIARTPGVGVSLGALGTWQGTLTVHYVNIYGQSVIQQYDRPVTNIYQWDLTNEEASGEIRDVTVTVSPWKWMKPREFVFPYSRGETTFDPVATYDEIPHSPVRNPDSSYTFEFAVRADRLGLVSDDDGMTWFQFPAGSEIPAGVRVLPVSYTDGPARRVITFTEASTE